MNNLTGAAEQRERSLTSTALQSGPRDPNDASEANPLFTYYTRRRDGERPLSIVAIIIALLTLYLAVNAAIHAHDIRPVFFYALFCALSTLASVILFLQWRNETLVARDAGLVHFDWLAKPTAYPWASISDAVEKRRPDNRRLVLQVKNGRSFVLHADFLGYAEALEACRERLARADIEITVDDIGTADQSAPSGQHESI